MRKQIHIFSLLLLLVSSQVWGQQPQLEKVTIASGGHIVHFLPLDVVVAKRFFADEGLDAEITQLKGGTATAQALLAGQVDFSLNSIDHAFKAAVQGKDDLRMVVLLNRLPGMVLVVDSKLRNKVNSIADLKGRALGVTSKGSATHMVLASLLSKSGVNPLEVSIIDAGAATFPPALENRQIAGGIALEPFASILVEQGKAFVLADLNTLKDTERFLGGAYNQAGVMTRQDVIDRQPSLVQKVVNVHIRALKWIKDHTPEEIADALPREVVGTDEERYVKTLEKLREFYSPDGVVNPQGVENVYHSMVASGALVAGNPLEFEKFYTNDFITKALARPASNMQATEQKPSLDSPPAAASNMIQWGPVNVPQTVVSGLVGFLVGYLLGYWKQKRQLEEIKRSGLYPLKDGLKGFEDEICESIKTATTSVQLCLSTPLLHSLKEGWIKYDAYHLSSRPTDHWAREFCEPLRTMLRERRDAGSMMRVEMVCLDDKTMEKFVSEVPEPPIPWGEYKDSIEHFFSILRTDGGSSPNPVCDLFVMRVPEVPIYIAIIDGPQNDGVCPDTAKGFVAFMGSTELMAQRRSGRKTPEIATKLQAFRFTNPEVIRFFSRLFRDVSLHGDERLLQFLQQCQRGQYSWALVTDAVSDGQDNPTPYATLLQPTGADPNVTVSPGRTGSGGG